MKILLSLFAILPLIAWSQFNENSADDVFKVGINPKPKGHVKSVQTKCNTLISLTEILTKANQFDLRDEKFNLNYPNITVNMNKDSLVAGYELMDSSSKVIKNLLYEYNQNKQLTVVYSIDVNGNKKIMSKSMYDNQNRFIRSESYDSLNKISSSYTITYKGNAVTKVYKDETIHDTQVVEIEYLSNKKISTQYFPDGSIDWKCVEENINNRKHLHSKFFHNDHTVSQETETFSDDKISTFSITVFNEYSPNWSNKMYATLNENGDEVESKITNKGCKKCVPKIIKTYRYEYDTHGNFTRKIIMIDNIPIIEITRTIEYYN